MQDIYYPQIDQTSLNEKETFYGITLVRKSITQNDSPSTISHISQATPTYSPFTNERSNNNSPETTQISHELINLITLQQQIQHPQSLIFHQLSSNITSSKPPTATPSSDYTTSLAQSSTSTHSSSTTNRAYRTYKKNS